MDVENDKKIVHKSVLLDEIKKGLNLRPGSILVDGTFGGGGHSLELCKMFDRMEIIAIDQDRDALHRAKELFHGVNCKLHTHEANFREIDMIVGQGNVDAVLLDLGLSSDQLENSDRGFSFLRDEPLLMTYKAHPKERDLTAMDIVNDWNEDNIATILKGYGEERYAKRIARAIVEARKNEEIKTTLQLVEIIKLAVPQSYQRRKIHPATKTFQALRMAVNDELNTLELGLRHGFEALKPGGRMAVISFHSLEDRMVKRYFKAKAKLGEAILVNKRPITASSKELERNKCARSAKLRIIEKVEKIL